MCEKRLGNWVDVNYNWIDYDDSRMLQHSLFETAIVNLRRCYTYSEIFPISAKKFLFFCI